MTNKKMNSEEREQEWMDMVVATALRVEALERQVAMLGAALGPIQDHLSDSELDAEIEEVMLAASAEKKAQQEEERAAA